MNKMQMAHDWAMRCNRTDLTMKGFVDLAWEYADAMKAEAEKREDKARPDVLNMANSPQLEWQPDWSQAPDGYNWWSVDENGTANFSGKKPHIEGHQWVYYSAAGEKPCHIEAPSFNYQGNWKNSLRKRPQ